MSVEGDLIELVNTVTRARNQYKYGDVVDEEKIKSELSKAERQIHGIKQQLDEQ